MLIENNVSQRLAGIRKWSPAVLSLSLFVLMPWWAIRRPAFLTPEYVAALHRLSDYKRVYGAAPDDFKMLFFWLFSMLFITTVMIILFSTKENLKAVCAKMLYGITALQTLLLGGLISIYAVMIPCSVSLSGYIKNTRHVTYAILTSLHYGGFLIHRAIDLSTIQKMIKLHTDNSSFLLSFFGLFKIINVHVFVFVIFVLLASLLRLLMPTSKGKRAPYILILIFFATGLLMDFFATMRWKEIFLYYAVYSFPLYGMGIVLWLSYELKGGAFFQLRQFKNFIALIVIVLLTSHMYIKTKDMVQAQSARGVSNQDPRVQLYNVKVNAAPFFEVLDGVSQ